MEYSVLTSIYKNDRPQFVRIAFESIVKQTHLPEKVIVVIDGTIDKEMNRVIDHFSKNRLFHFIRLRSNIGLGLALNEGLKYVDTKYVMRMDSDDLILPQKAKKQLDFLKEKNAKLVGTYIGEFYNDKETKIDRIITYHGKVNGNVIRNYYRDPVGHATVMMESSILKQVGGYRNVLAFEDTDLWLRIGKLNFTFYTIPEVLYYARIGDEFHLRRKGLDYLKNEVKVFRLFLDEGLISKTSFLLNIPLRTIIRLLPLGIVRMFYDHFLRKKV